MFAIISEAPHCNYFISYLSILMQLHCMTLQCIQKYPKAICSGKYDSYSPDSYGNKCTSKEILWHSFAHVCFL